MYAIVRHSKRTIVNMIVFLLAILTLHSFIRFLLVGVINTVVGLSAMYLFLHGFSLSYWASTFIGNIIGACVSYFLNRTFTFKSSTAVGKSMVRFTLVILACYVISYYL